MLPALGNLPRKGAIGQATADEATLACALERYRLAHGQLPDRLEALAPDFIAALPHDVITGAAYKYQRTADSFLLYSVGWNETEDGGKVAMRDDGIPPKAIGSGNIRRSELRNAARLGCRSALHSQIRVTSRRDSCLICQWT